MSVIARTIRCTTCHGSGKVESNDSTDDCIYKCWACAGTGKIADRRRPDPQLAGAVNALDTIARVLDRGVSDDRKLATITRLMHEARPSTARGQSGPSPVEALRVAQEALAQVAPPYTDRMQAIVVEALSTVTTTLRGQ